MGRMRHARSTNRIVLLCVILAALRSTGGFFSACPVIKALRAHIYKKVGKKQLFFPELLTVIALYGLF